MKPELIDFVEKFKGKRILIIGDMIADIYLKGDISRISREAPVLVLIESEEKNRISGVYVGLVSDWWKIQCLSQTESRYRRFRKQRAL